MMTPFCFYSPTVVATRMLVAGPASTSSGGTPPISVFATDSKNRLAQKYLGTVTFTSNDPDATMNPDTTLAGGKGQFFGFTLVDVQDTTITATDTVTASITGNCVITVNP